MSLGGEVLTGWCMTGLPLDDGEELETGAARVREDARTNKQYKQFLRLARQRPQTDLKRRNSTAQLILFQ